MKRSKKEELVNSLTEEFKETEAIVVCEYKGLKVKELEKLRASAKETDVKVQVIKNTLANIAMQNANIQDMVLQDTNIFLWGEQLSVSKVAANFNKDHDIFIIKSAYMDGEITDQQKVIAMSKMPSRDELLAMLLQVWKAPIANFTIGLDALRAKKESA